MSEVLDATSTAATVLAAGLAAWSIEQNRRGSREAEQRLLAERREDFYLEQIAAIAHMAGASSSLHQIQQPFLTLCRMLPPEDFQKTRVGFGGTEDAQVRQAFNDRFSALHDAADERGYGNQHWDLIREMLHEELDEALGRHLARRPVSQPLARQRWYQPRTWRR